MSNVFNVLMVGVGGQGVVLASDILAEAAMLSGQDAKKSEIHGMSQRGGPVFAHVRFGDHVSSPVIPQGEADVILAMERMELLRWAAWASPSCVAVYVDKDILPTGVASYPSSLDADIAAAFPQHLSISAKALRPSGVSPKVMGTVLLGAASTRMPLDPAAFAPALEALVPPGTYDANLAGFALGRELSGLSATV